MYATLLDTANEHIDRLQIIVTDNDSPPIDGIHRALELSDTHRLVPGASVVTDDGGYHPADDQAADGEDADTSE